MKDTEIGTGLLLLHIAVADGSFDLVDFLLSIGANVGVRTALPPCSSPLHISAERGDIPIYSLLLGTEPTLVNVQDADGNTPLHTAATARNIHIIDFTLSEEQRVEERGSIVRALKNKAGLLPQDILRKCGHGVKLHTLARKLDALLATSGGATSPIISPPKRD